MKKMIIEKKKAFTLIELMTTTVIMAIIICAAIPFAMKKDIQKRAVAGHTGIFECYYDGDTLMQHIRTKDGDDRKPQAVSGGACSFNPNAEYTKGAKSFQIIAIGGGGAGGTYNAQGAADSVVSKAIKNGVKENSPLNSAGDLKTLVSHGKLKFGPLSNTAGQNAWYWDGNKSSTDCTWLWQTTCGNCSAISGEPWDGHCTCKNHKPAKVCGTGTNTGYLSIYNIGARLCSLEQTDLMTKSLPEDDIYQAIYKHYGIAGDYKYGNYGDITYNIKAPSGIASCACINANSSSIYQGGCMGTKHASVAGSAGDSYEYSMHSGDIRGAYIGNEFLTSNGSKDQTSQGSLSGFCDNKLKLQNTNFTCGTSNGTYQNACSGSTEKTAPNRGFPNYYYKGNSYHPYSLGTTKSAIDSYSPKYHKITMHWTTPSSHNRSLNDYGGNMYLRLATHAGSSDYALIPRGHHGNIPTTGGTSNPYKTTVKKIDSAFPGYVFANHIAAGASNASGACSSLTNSYYNAQSDTLWQVAASCSDSASAKCNCVTTCSESGSCSTHCTHGSAACSDSTSYSEYYYGSGQTTTKTASCSKACSACGCNASCSKTNNKKKWTASDYTCEHLNCCNNFDAGSKTYTVRYNTGTRSGLNGDRMDWKDIAKDKLQCGDAFYIYRQIKGVPFERAFVASAGQNGQVRQAAYPKLNETLLLTPGKGGSATSTGDNVKANGEASTVKKGNGQIILSAQGGIKGASDKMNGAWVGPCMVFSHGYLGTDTSAGTGCMARQNVMAKPTYNALLMANRIYLKSVDIKSGNDYQDMPGLGGNGAYANVFPDRFLLSKAVRDQIILQTNYIGPNPKKAYKDSEGLFIIQGLDNFTTEEFLGNSTFKKEFDKRMNKLSEVSAKFLQQDDKEDGRVPNFIEAKDGNKGAIVIIW